MDQYEGRYLGRYYLAKHLSTGGMGSVYLARFEGPKGFEKVVVVKVIHPDYARLKNVVSMFFDEAKLSAQINHVNVCSILDFDTAGDVHYLVMEHLEGTTLSALLQKARRAQGISPSVVARIVADAARGLHAAHELRNRDGELLNVVHRDVSPQNIFVLHEGATKIIDFGIVRARGRVATTQVKELKGKVPYMAPEQIRCEPVDRRADLWSLGVVLWEATLGRRLFAGESFMETMAQALERPIPRPRDLDPTYPEALERVVLGALQRDREDRLPTAAAMASALEAFLYSRGEPCGPDQVAAQMAIHFSEQMRERRELTTEIVNPSKVTTAPDEVARFAPPEAARPARPEAPLAAPGEVGADEADRDIDIDAVLAVPREPTTEIHLPSEGESDRGAPQARGSWALPVAVVAVVAVAALALTFVVGPQLFDREEAATTSVMIEGRQPSSLEPLVDPPELRRPMPGRATASPGSGERERSGPPDEARADEALLIASADADALEASTADVELDRGGARPSRRARPRSEPAAEERAEGSLNLLAIPASEVSWRGKSLGRTPLLEIAMPVGRQVLLLRPEGGGAPRRVTVVISPGETTRRTIHLE